MIDCAICGKTLKTVSGLVGHVKFKHMLSYDDYKAGRYENEPEQPPQTLPASQPPSLLQQPVTLSEESLRGVVSQLYSMFQASRAMETQLPRGVTPIPGLEEVEVVSEKINYKVALNPDVIWRWNVFKGQNQRLHSMGQAELFQGDFSDFLDLATKTLLSTYGIYPIVMTLSQGKMMVEMPATEWR